MKLGAGRYVDVGKGCRSKSYKGYYHTHPRLAVSLPQELFDLLAEEASRSNLPLAEIVRRRLRHSYEPRQIAEKVEQQ